jgi:uncharacterized membrane protein
VSEFFVNLGIPRELVVIIIAALPIFELRGAIPVALFTLNMPWYTALPLAVLGNLLPIPFILLFLEKIMEWLGHVVIFRRFFDWLSRRTMRRTEKALLTQNLGLAAFVAVPLPVTGAWTGSLAAVLFKFRFARAMLSIIAGVIIAGVIVTVLCELGLQAYLFISS